MTRKSDLEAEFELDEAIRKFAAISPKKSTEAEGNTDFRGAEPTFEDLKKIGGAIYAGFDDWNKSLLLQQKRLCDQILSGRLVATGVQVRPRPVAGRRLIPAYLFENPKLQRAQGWLENYGIRYEAVRIKRAPTKNVISATLPYQKVLPGRPSRANQIDDAIERLLKSGVQVDTLSRKVAISKIRDEVLKIDPASKEGLSDPVIQRVINRRFGKKY